MMLKLLYLFILLSLKLLDFWIVNYDDDIGGVILMYHGHGVTNAILVHPTGTTHNVQVTSN